MYARVSSVYDWIKFQVCTGSKLPPADFDCDSIKRRESLMSMGGTGETSVVSAEAFPSSSSTVLRAWLIGVAVFVLILLWGVVKCCCCC